jgi:hypothetical protein
MSEAITLLPVYPCMVFIGKAFVYESHNSHNRCCSVGKVTGFIKDRKYVIMFLKYCFSCVSL